MAVGQEADLISNAAASSRISKSGLLHPTSVSFDSGGNLLVADGLARVVVYYQGASTNTPATRILGVDTSQNAAAVSAISVGNVTSAVAVGNNVVVIDNSNNRVLDPTLR